MEQNQNGRNELFLKACADGFSDVIEFLLNAGGIDLNYLDHNDHSCLWMAVHHKNVEVVQRLLQIGGLHLLTLNSAIEEAHKQGLNDLVLDIMDYPKAVNHSPRDQKADLLRLCNGLHGFDFDVLTAAIKLRNFSLAEKIIDVAEIYIDPTADFTPLVSAIESGNGDLVQKLMRKKEIDINSYGLMEVPPLFSAVKSPEIIGWLLKRSDFNVRRKDRKDNTVLHKAVQECAFDSVRLLVEYGGVKIDAVNKDASCFLTEESRKNLNTPYGDTPTAGTDRTFGYQPLLGRRIPVGDYSKTGLTALQTAVALGYSDIALYLINEAGARVDIPLPGDIPLLFLAIHQKMEDVVRAILQRLSLKQLNAVVPDPNHQKLQVTALHIAFRARALNIFKMLLEYPIDVNYGQHSEIREDVVKGAILGEVFYVYRRSKDVWDYMEALLKRQDLNVHICTSSPFDNRTVFQIMADEKAELLDYCSNDTDKAAKRNNGYDWHC